MRTTRPTPAALRAEARLLSTAGIILLLIGFPLTLWLVAGALAENGISPILPLAIGARRSLWATSRATSHHSVW
ncbi:MAG: hypothetical protein M0D54_21155 [Hyphomonadaceae bacterium JAD_PAG50586_4]|nr:MAG: hypothetical protein M0D54_21155 [Hyphomonadaceae bacterium JAD_PAG50586_4]